MRLGLSELGDIAKILRTAGYERTVSVSILQLSAASNITPARSMKSNSRSRPRTKRVARCGSARSAAAAL